MKNIEKTPFGMPYESSSDLDPYDTLLDFGRKYWGDRLDEADRPVWWHVSDYRDDGGEIGYVTDGKQYFSLGSDGNMFKLDLLGDGRVFSVTTFEGKGDILDDGHRQVLWD